MLGCVLLGQLTMILHGSFSVKSGKSVIFEVSRGHNVFGINNLCRIYFCDVCTYRFFLELINDLHL